MIDVRQQVVSLNSLVVESSYSSVSHFHSDHFPYSNTLNDTRSELDAVHGEHLRWLKHHGLISAYMRVKVRPPLASRFPLSHIVAPARE